MKTEQGSLDLKSDKESSGPWFLQVRRRNLIRFLAAGIIGPRHVIAKYRSGDIVGLFDKSVLLFKGGFDLAELEGLAEKADAQDIPALMEIDQQFAERHLAANFLSKGSRGLMQIPFVASMNAVSKIHLRSDKEFADFIARQFENVSLESFTTRVSPELFSYKRDPSLVEQLSAVKETGSEPNEKLANSAKIADRLVGGIAMLAYALPGTDSWVNGFVQVLDELCESLPDSGGDVPKEAEVLSSFNATLLKSLGEVAATEDNEIDEALLLSTMLTIASSDITDGWNAEEVLARIVGDVERRTSKGSNGKFKEWREFCLRALKNEIDVPRSVFADRRDLVRRAIFLLLLRPDPAAVISTTESSLKAGESVRALAALLAGMRIGFEGLSTVYKTDLKRYEGMAELKSWLVNCLWKGKDASNTFFKGAPKTTIKRETHRSGELRRLAIISVNNFKVAEISLQLPAALREVSNLAEEVRVPVEYEEDQERLVIRFEDDQEVPCSIYVSGLGGHGRDGVVRFWTPCLDVSTPGKLKKLTKSKAVELLRKNGAPNTHARFALDEGHGAVIAAVDQVGATIQEEELRSHLSSVARLVRWFESGV